MSCNQSQLRTFRRWKAAGKTVVEIMDITGIKMRVLLQIEKNEAKRLELEAKISHLYPAK